jgi:hypothetical protein
MNGRGNCEKYLKGRRCMNLVAAVESVSTKLALQRGLYFARNLLGLFMLLFLFIIETYIIHKNPIRCNSV